MNVNATAKAKFVDSANRLRNPAFLPMTSMHVEFIVEEVALIRLSAPTLCLSVVLGPVGLRVMALSVVVVPGSDYEEVFP